MEQILRSAEFCQLCYIFFFFGFIGWVMESTIFTIEEKRFVNRGFLTGPVLPVYGFGVCLILMLLQGENSIGAIFITGVVFCSLLEYFAGWMLERVFNTKLWDYSTYPFNIKGRICLSHSLIWGVLCIGVVRFGVPFVLSFVDQLGSAAYKILSGLILITLVDLVTSVYYMLDLQKITQKIQDARNELKEAIEHNKEKLKIYSISHTDFDESTEKLYTLWQDFLAKANNSSLAVEARKNVIKIKVKYHSALEKGNFLQKRIARAYPNMKLKNHRSFQEWLEAKKQSRKKQG